MRVPGAVAAFGGWGRVVEQQADGTKIEVSAETLEDLEDLYGELRGVSGIAAHMVSAPPKPGEQGSLADLLTVALTSGAVTALLQIIKTVAESRGPGFRLQIRRGKDQLEITARDADKGLAALRDMLDGS
jgi:hypothetical protein